MQRMIHVQCTLQYMTYNMSHCKNANAIENNNNMYIYVRTTNTIGQVTYDRSIYIHINDVQYKMNPLDFWPQGNVSFNIDVGMAAAAPALPIIDGADMEEVD